jgi:hypothetical protein
VTVTGFTFGSGSANVVQTTWSATCPTVSAGDTLVVVASTNGTTPILSVSGGGTGVTWASLSTGNPDVDGLGIVSNVWIATATGSSSGSTISISSNTAGRLMGAGVAVTGFIPTGAVVNTTQQTTASTSVPFPSVTIPNANGWQLLGLAVMRVASTTTATLTAPSGSTKVAESASAYTSSAEFTDVVVASNSTVGSGSRSPGTGTGSTSVTDCTLYTVGLAPAAAAASATGSITLGGSATAQVASAAGTITLGGSGTAAAAAAAAGTITLGGSATGPPPPPPPPGLPPIISASARWSWAAGDWHGLPTMELANAVKRSMQLRLTGTSSVTFDLQGSADEASVLQELIGDVWCMRNGFTLFRGRVGPTSESDSQGVSPLASSGLLAWASGTSKPTSASMSYTAGDYRALLQRRLLFDSDTLTYTSTDQASIAWGLVTSTQAQSGGNLNLTNSAGVTGTARTITYPAGQSIGQAIEQLSLMDAGFNWDVVPATGRTAQAFTVWPSRGDSKQRVVDFPGCVAKYQRSVDPGSYANAVRETGNTGISPVTLAASDVSSRAEGRWDAQLGDTSLLDAASVTSRAAYDLAARQQIVPTYTVTLQAGAWGGPPDIWLGDAVLLVISTPLRKVSENLRVFEIDIDLDDADNETVTLTLSALDPFKRARSQQVDFRLTQLERR